MINYNEKHRGFLFILILYLLITLGFSTSCHTQQKSLPTDEKPKKLTRMEYYKQLYNTIQNDELLRSIYTPIKTTYDAAALFLDNISFDNNSNSYETLVTNRKKTILDQLQIDKFTYTQGNIQEQSIWTWHNSSAKVNIWENLFSDYSSLSKHNKKIIDFLCQNGLIIIDSTQSNKLCLNLHKEVTLFEKKKLENTIYLKKRNIPINAIETSDYSGNKIYLAFSDYTSLNIIQKTLSYLYNTNELLNSFVYFDSSATTLALWVSTSSCGTFSIPLTIGVGTQINLPCCTNEASINQRLNITKSFVPESKLESYNDFCNSINFDNLSNYYFKCDFSYLPQAELTIRISTQDTSVCFVSLDLSKPQ